MILSELKDRMWQAGVGQWTCGKVHFILHINLTLGWVCSHGGVENRCGIVREDCKCGENFLERLRMNAVLA